MRHNRTLMRRLRQGVLALEDYCESLSTQLYQETENREEADGRIRSMLDRNRDELQSSINWAKDDLRSRIDGTDRELESVRRSIPSDSSYGSRW